LGVAKKVTKGNLWGFIQSRPYASVADIRRTFALDVETASPVRTSEGTYFIGLPQEAAALILQLWNEGRIVLDVNPDVKANVVQGLYPARPLLARQAAAAGGAEPAARTAPAGQPVGVPGAGAAAAAGEAGAPAGGTKASRKRRRRRKKRRSGAATPAAQPAAQSAV
jgi:hypothetical protein